MKKLYAIIIFGVFFSNGISQWIQSSAGLYGGKVNYMYFDGSSLFACTKNNGVFKSVNSGVSFFQLNNGLADLNITSLFYFNGFHFTGTANNSVYRSDNGGNNWIQKSAGLPVYIVKAFCSNNNILFAGTDGGGVYKSTNNGEFWLNSSSGLTNTEIKTLYNFNGNIYAGTNNGIFMSSNNGVNWVSRNGGIPNYTFISSIKSLGNEIYAGCYFGSGVYKSVDGGINWTGINSGLPASIYVYSLAVINNSVIAGTSEGVFRSTNSGNSWVEINSGLFNFEINSVTTNGSDLFAGTNQGHFKSSNSGNYWLSANEGFPPDIPVTVIYNHSSGMFAGTYGNGVFKSTDNGNFWIPMNNGMTGFGIESFCELGNTIFASSYNGIYATSNGGINWRQCYPDKLIYSICVKDGILFAGICSCSGGGIIFSTDDGNSWDFCSNGLDGENVLAMASLNGRVYAGVNDGIYCSTNNGANWVQKKQGLPEGSSVCYILIQGNNIFIGTTEKGVFVSGNYGEDWIPVGSGIPQGVKINKIEYISGNLIVSTGYGIYYKPSSVSQWLQINQGLPFTDVAALTISGSNVFAGTGISSHNGIWKRPLIEILPVKNISTEFPSETTIDQNYPNPFNPLTKIRFSVKQKDIVKISVYNNLGQLMKILLNNVFDPGTYETSFDASAFSSGIYYYRFEAGSYSDVKKMVLLK